MTVRPASDRNTVPLGVAVLGVLVRRHRLARVRRGCRSSWAAHSSSRLAAAAIALLTTRPSDR